MIDRDIAFSIPLPWLKGISFAFEGEPAPFSSKTCQPQSFIGSAVPDILIGDDLIWFLQIVIAASSSTASL